MAATKVADRQLNTAPGGAAGLTATSLVVPYGKPYATATITDAAISPSSNIKVEMARNIADTDENSPEMDDFQFLAFPSTGSALVRIFASRPFGGALNVQYQVS